jgi:hypothetical protein
LHGVVFTPSLSDLVLEVDDVVILGLVLSVDQVPEVVDFSFGLTIELSLLLIHCNVDRLLQDLSQEGVSLVFWKVVDVSQSSVESGLLLVLCLFESFSDSGIGFILKSHCFSVGFSLDSLLLSYGSLYFSIIGLLGIGLGSRLVGGGLFSL